MSSDKEPSNGQGRLSRMSAITISRSYGSGGGEIAARLARRLGWRLIDHEIVAQVARRLGIAEQDAEAEDEHVESFVERVFLAMQLAFPPDTSTIPPPQSIADLEYSYSEALRSVVDTAYLTREVVIVGRGSQVLLADRPDVFHARIVAPLERRVVYVARREGLDVDAARARIELKDRDRKRYIQTLHHHSVDDLMLYDLVINTGVLDLDSAVDLVQLGLERKARQLGAAADALGPGAGLGRYEGPTGELRRPGANGGQP